VRNVDNVDSWALLMKRLSLDCCVAMTTTTCYEVRLVQGQSVSQSMHSHVDTLPCTALAIVAL